MRPYCYAVAHTSAWGSRFVLVKSRSNFTGEATPYLGCRPPDMASGLDRNRVRPAAQAQPLFGHGSCRTLPVVDTVPPLLPSLLPWA